MRAAVCRVFGAPLLIEELSLAAPETDELQVDVRACAICHSDITYAEGSWGGQLPAVYGHEAAGVVSAVGPGVAGVAPGDHVIVTLMRSCGSCFHCTRGECVLCEGSFRLDAAPLLTDATGATVHQGLRTAAFAERVVVHRSQVAAVPRGLPFEVASLLACGVTTGVGAVVNTARVPSGSSVVVIGVGGVGLNVVQGAVIAGASPVIAVDVSDAKLTAAGQFGATHGINAQSHDVAAEVAALTGGRRADYVFVTVGVSAAVEQGIGLMRRGGTTVIVGMPGGDAKAEFAPASFAAEGQRLVGSKMGSSRLPADIIELVRLHGAGRLKLEELITGRYPLDEINEAIASATRGEAIRNVIVFPA